MASILIDSVPADLQYPEGADVGQVFELLREQVWQDGRIIAEISVDGQPVMWGDESPVWQAPFDQIQRLHVQTAVALDLSLSLLQQIRERMPSFADAHRTAARLLREGNQQDGINQTADVLPVWKDIHEGVRQICLLHGIDYSQSEWSELESLLVPRVQKVSDQLNELHESITARDFVLTADLLDYELAPLAEQWEEVCITMSDLLKQRFSKEGE